MAMMMGCWSSASLLLRPHTSPLRCLPSPSDHTAPTCLLVGAHLIPHPDKVEKGGEDAFFFSSRRGRGVVAIADGVSGWAEQNVDPSLFSRELMANVKSLVDNNNEEVDDNPQVLMRKAHAATSSTGSATVIIAALESDGVLNIANVGDCGLRVIRGGELLFATSPQEHYFDCPYQLSSETVGQTYLDAVVSNVKLQKGDTIVLGSDGLFDNVFDHDIISTIASHGDVLEAAKTLANIASTKSMDSEYESPYALEARSKGLDVPWWKKILGKNLSGGKLDDITVIVGQVITL